MATRISNPAIQHFDKGTGAQLAGGQLFFFETGTTTPKSVFDDALETTALTNPVLLDGNGFEPDIFGTGSYKIVLQNSDDVQQWERDPVDFEVDEGAFSEWLPTISYGVNDIVEGSDGEFYISIIAINLNNDPVASPTAWSQFDLLNRWNTNETYNINDVVRSEDSGGVYTSVTASNEGNDPTLDTTATNWKMVDDLRFSGSSISVTAVDTGLFLSANGTGNINIASGDGGIQLVSTGIGPLTFNSDLVSVSPISTQFFDTAGAGTWTKPDDIVKFIMSECIGGGGGGGSNNDDGILTNAAGQGGGGGAYARSFIDVSSIASISFTIGAGGIGRAQDSGLVGGNTIFSSPSPMRADGGGGGETGNLASGTGYSPNGGSILFATGDILIEGGSGIAPFFNGSASKAGDGGGNYFKPLGTPGNFRTVFTSPGGNGIQGTGGSGARSAVATGVTGGNGGDGIIIVTEYR